MTSLTPQGGGEAPKNLSGDTSPYTDHPNYMNTTLKMIIHRAAGGGHLVAVRVHHHRLLHCQLGRYIYTYLHLSTHIFTYQLYTYLPLASLPHRVQIGDACPESG